MRILAFDVTAPRLTVGIADGGSVLRRWNADAKRDRGTSLDHLIDRALEEFGWKRTTIEGLALVTGPGSLTATRIGWATASGWAAAQDIPVTGWTTPEVQHRWWKDHDIEGRQSDQGAGDSDVSIHCLVHHRGDEFYCYRLDGNIDSQVRPDVVRIGIWQPPSEKQAWVVGPGLLGYRDRWAESLGKHARLAPETYEIIGGDDLARWGESNLLSGNKFTLTESPLDYGLPPDFRKAS